jgi:plastocyanin
MNNTLQRIVLPTSIIKTHGMKKNVRKIIGSMLILAILPAFILSSCEDSKDDDAVLGPNEVAIQSNAFTPLIITVPVNTTIIWTNKDANSHTVTSNDNSFDSGNITTNGTYSHQFTSAGTYQYHCSIHSNMTGTVIVQ